MFNVLFVVPDLLHKALNFESDENRIGHNDSLSRIDPDIPAAPRFCFTTQDDFPIQSPSPQGPGPEDPGPAPWWFRAQNNV